MNETARSVEVSNRDWALLAAGGLAALSAPTQMVVAAEYLSIEQAQKSLFPAADRFDTVILALNPAQKQAVVLAYRESHGGEVRSDSWRHQFAGRQKLDQLRFEADIKNIAGSTLSCGHVTQGGRWLVALWEVTLRPDATVPAA